MTEEKFDLMNKHIVSLRKSYRDKRNDLLGELSREVSTLSYMAKDFNDETNEDYLMLELCKQYIKEIEKMQSKMSAMDSLVSSGELIEKDLMKTKKNCSGMHTG